MTQPVSANSLTVQAFLEFWCLISWSKITDGNASLEYLTPLYSHYFMMCSKGSSSRIVAMVWCYSLSLACSLNYIVVSCCKLKFITLNKSVLTRLIKYIHGVLGGYLFQDLDATLSFFLISVFVYNPYHRLRGGLFITKVSTFILTQITLRPQR